MEYADHVHKNTGQLRLTLVSTNEQELEFLQTMLSVIEMGGAITAESVTSGDELTMMFCDEVDELMGRIVSEVQ